MDAGQNHWGVNSPCSFQTQIFAMDFPDWGALVGRHGLKGAVKGAMPRCRIPKNCQPRSQEFVFSQACPSKFLHRGYYPFFPLQNWPYSITAPQHPGWIMLDLFTCLGGAWGCDEGWIVCPVLVGQWTWQLRDSTQQWIQWQCPLQNQGSYIFNVIIFEHDIPTGECEVLGKEMISI